MGEVIKTKAGEIEIVHVWPMHYGSAQNLTIMCRAICYCGKLFQCKYLHLQKGNTNSCGCFRSYIASSKAFTQFYKHGHACNQSITVIYTTWKRMRSLCSNPNEKWYAIYGGKGIKVSDEWLSSFETFLSDMGEKPAGYRMNRIDKEGDFEPDNCEWVPIKRKKRKL